MSNLYITLFLVLVALLIRWLVAQFPHSGQGNPPMYGDYEAQRHWMEITTNLKVTDWYKNKINNQLRYWGLDYPPLTAYHMYILGKVAKNINESWVELETSRGIETEDHKAFMRSTVIVSDLTLYISGIVYYFRNVEPSCYVEPLTNSRKVNMFVYMAAMLLYPAQILIDHGHFQYNCVFLGLVVWSIIFMSKKRPILMTLTYTLAIGYKQMALYYSLGYFYFCLGLSVKDSTVKAIARILIFSSTVLFTFLAIFYPYLGRAEDLLSVLIRVFPFNRGLFEDKVANFWFLANLLLKFKDDYPIPVLVRMSSTCTIMASIPSGIHVLLEPTFRNFKYTLINSSLAFFLFSFQVHEKSILIPAVPILLLYREHSLAANWFAIVSTYSLQPLLLRDDQTVPYFVLMALFTVVTLEVFHKNILLDFDRLYSLKNLFICLYLTSVTGCWILSGMSVFVAPPTNLPHIHTVVNTMYCAAHFIGFLIYFTLQQIFGETEWGAINLFNRGQPDVHLIKKKNV